MQSSQRRLCLRGLYLLMIRNTYYFPQQQWLRESASIRGSVQYISSFQLWFTVTLFVYSYITTRSKLKSRGLPFANCKTEVLFLLGVRRFLKQHHICWFCQLVLLQAAFDRTQPNVEQRWNGSGGETRTGEQLYQWQCAHHPTWPERARNRASAHEPWHTPSKPGLGTRAMAHTLKTDIRPTVHKILVCISQKIHPLSIMNITQLTLFRTGISPNCGNHIKRTNTLCVQNIFKLI